MDIERRTFEASIKVEYRGDDKTPVISGHAAVFNKLSENLGGFREKIDPGAFVDVLNDDVRALYNHDPNLIHGRTTSKTLRIDEDKTGLAYEVDPPDTQSARDLIVSMERGDVNQSSFAFTVEEDSWDEDDDGRIVRTIKKIKRLFDVSPVTYPAYPDATVGLRGLDAYQKRKTDEQKPKGHVYKEKTRLAEITGAQ